MPILAAGHEGDRHPLPVPASRLLHVHLRLRHRTFRRILCQRIQESFQDQGRDPGRILGALL